MFINVFLQNSGWNIAGSVPLDSCGYPVMIPYLSHNEATTLISSNKAVIKDDSVYVVQWDGDGDIEFNFWDIGSSTFTPLLSEPNRIEFVMDYDSDPLRVYHISLKITRSSSSDPVRNIRIYHDDYEDLYENQGEKFDPRYVSMVDVFYALRTHGAFNINQEDGCQFVEWADRTTTDWYNQSRGNFGNGLAYEHAVDLSNKLQSHLWFNSPHKANNDAIRKMAELVYERLDPDLNVYLEYSNEVWNWAPAYWHQSNYAMIHGQLYFNGGIHQGYADLSRNLFRIWREVFGKDSLRVKRVCAVQTISDLNHNAIPRINAMGAEHFDVFSPTYYMPGMQTNWCNIDDAFDEILASIRGGDWYQTRKANVELGKAYGKEIFHYEGGIGADPEDKDNYNCLSVVQAMQTDPRMFDVIKEGLDSMASMGAEGGNELALFGNWEVNLVNDLVGFWGNIGSVDDDPADYPKYNAYANSFSDCDNLTKSTDTVGSGLAFRMDGVNDYVEASVSYTPNDVSEDYTIETWVRAEKLGFDQYIWSMSYGTAEATNYLYLAESNRFKWEIKNNAGTSIASLTGPLVELNEWNHVAAVKSGNTYTLYINGSEKASMQGNITGNCTKSRFVFGGKVHAANVTDNFCGRIDEFRIWNTGISNLTTLRDNMCRKIGVSHPNFTSLRAYYRFDEVNMTGVVKDQFGGLNVSLENVKYSLYSNYMKSGAPIGDKSVQTYPPGWDGVSLTYFHPNGDRLSVSGLGDGNPEGVHIYEVSQEPIVSTPPSEQYIKLGSYYYGVFAANGNDPVYSVIFNYTGNPDAASTDESNRMLKRQSNADENGWQNTGSILNVFAKTLTTRIKRESSRAEYIIGQRPNLVKDLSGPGYAVRFEESSEGALINYERPDDEYTAMFWSKVDAAPGGHSSGKYIAFIGPGYANYSQLYYSSVGDLTFVADKGWDDSQERNSRILDQSGWNHIAIVKEDDYTSVYVNGRRRIGPLLMGYNSGGTKRDVGFKKIRLGGQNFKGWMDEFTLWDVALDQATIREWMCREITDLHAYEAENLLLYYNFDEGQGIELENKRGPGDMILSGTSWAQSGAPVGDTSVFYYQGTRTDNFTMSIPHPNGDSLEVEKTSGELFGMHLFRVDGKAQFSNIPGGVQSWDSTRYWGVYPITVGYTGARDYTYKASYYYNGNENINMAEEANLRLLNRKDNMAADWNLNDVAPDPGQFFDETYDAIHWTNPPFWYPYMTNPQEFVLGANTSSAIFVDPSLPDMPGNITGKDPVCSGETNVVYSVPADPDPNVFYVWTLPPGLSGYSDSSSININVAPTADGSLGDIEVAAVNKNGVGPSQTLSVTAVLTGSLTESISGPAEICADESSTYSIPDVGASSYTWEIPGDASIIDDNGTSIDVDFGSMSGNVTVYGNYTCGTALVNTKPVTVNIEPDINLSISGNRVCLGEIDYGRVTIFNSELGVKYQLYKNFGTAPVGDPVYGTGFNLVILLPLSEMLAGDNSITAKAQMGNCPEVTLLNTATVAVDIPPDPDMPLYALEDTICKGYDAIIIAPNAAAGTHFLPNVDFDWTVDSDPPYDINPGTISEGGYTEIPIHPCRFNNQMANGGIAMGPNRVKMKATIGTCSTVELNTEVDVFVKNDPKSLDFSQWGLIWWIIDGGGNPWPEPLPDTSDYISFSISESNNICNTNIETVTIENAQLNVSYYLVYRYTGDALSDTIRCTIDGQTINLNIYPGVLPGGEDRNIDLKALGDCEITAKTFRVDVSEGPDITLNAYGSTVCGGDNGEITIENSQNGVNYQAFFFGGGAAGTPTSGNENDLTLTIPSAELGGSDKQFFIIATSSGCDYRIMEDSVDIFVVPGLDNGAQVIPEYTTVCGGTDAVFTVKPAQVGASYQLYADLSAIGPAVIAENSDSVILTAPDSDLQASYADQTVNFTVRLDAGSCATTTLTDDEDVYIDSYTYPDGTLGVSGRRNFPPCLWNNDTTEVRISQNVYNSNAGIDYMSLVVNGIPTATQTPTNASGGYIYLPASTDEMPRGYRQWISFYAYATGCPPKEVKNISWDGANSAPTKIPVIQDYHYETISTDTVCTGQIASIDVLNMDTSYFGLYYQIYDSVNDVPISLGYHTRWDSEDYPRYEPWEKHIIHMDITDPGLLQPGVNTFVLRGRVSGNNECGYEYVPNSELQIVVNEPPQTDLPIAGGSQCAGDGDVTISNTETDVIYEAYMGSKSVGTPQYGNGGDLILSVPQSELSAGANNITIKATRNECATKNMDYIALIEVTSSPPNKPGNITGETEICPDETNNQYSVPLDNQASGYTWILPNGATTSSNSNIALIDFATSGGGDIAVAANNICGAGDTSDYLTVNVKDQVNGGTISGDLPVCQGGAIDLTLSGYTGNIVKWQYAETPGNWIDVYETTDVISTGSLTDDTEFRALVEVPDCETDYSDAFTVIVDDTPIGNAGEDAIVSVCETENSLDLFSSLGGTPDTGGTWSDDDATGALTGGNFDPSAVEAESSYDFTYSFVVAGCAPATATVTVLVEAMPDAGSDTSVSVCQEPGQINLLNYLGGTPQNDGSWNDDDATGALTDSLFDLSTVTVGTYQFTYSIVSSAPCVGSSEATLEVTVNESPDISLTLLDDTICFGNTAELTIESSASGTHYTIYTLDNQLVTGPENGTGSDLLISIPASFTSGSDNSFYVEAALGNCIAILTDTAMVSTIPVPSPEISGSEEVCPFTEGESYSTADASNHTFAWTLDTGTIASATDLHAITVNFGNVGTATLMVTETDLASGCGVADTLIVSVADNMAPAIIDCPDESVRLETEYINEEFVHILQDTSLLINPTDACGIQSIVNSLNGEDNLGGQTLTEDVTITWTVTDYAGNESTCEIDVKLIIDKGITPPTAFTPGSDGFNDTWEIKLLNQLYPNAIVRIYDSTGKLVFESEKGYPEPWAGNSRNGVPLGIATYYYVIDLGNGKVKKGNVTIVR